jgi:HlyD family secretion protein
MQIASVKQAEESLAEKEEDLAKTAIYSPLTGTISKLNVELGERVLGSGFSQGTNLMTVSNLNDMEAVVEVDENDVVLVSEGDTAKITIDAFGDEEFTGVVYQIGNSAKQTGVGTQDQVVNFEIKIKLLGKNKKIKPGMSCDADIRTETHADVLSVPIQALTARIPEKSKNKNKKGEGGKRDFKKRKKEKIKPVEVVFVYDNGTAVMRPVKTGISDDDYIEITEGLSEGETIISGPYKAVSRELEDGKKVVIEKEREHKSKKEK